MVLKDRESGFRDRGAEIGFGIGGLVVNGSDHFRLFLSLINAMNNKTAIIV